MSKDYVHRIGRTGRGGAKGTSITFFTSDNSRQAKDLIKILKEANQEIPQELFAMERIGLDSHGSIRYSRGGSGTRHW
ncbi:ATP-dependent RNA helicase dbp2 [Entomophthora muscae]|uniref:ATP-dependent RNA helicase dbp2 n=1 Tax=Entomophthora muscae TaxID=34485 RepID=A0ACC2SLW0_9FUNG|nr:ATP-dependent RNA helicase dbp2 [Entomophthora muscae]